MSQLNSEIESSNENQNVNNNPNKETSQNDLRIVFANLLTELINTPIKLEFEDRADYKTGLYIDVCKEYIKDLNREIINVRKNIPEKLVRL